MFLDGCGYAGSSIIAGATFLHVASVDTPNANLAPQVLAAHVLADGRVDATSSTYGLSVHGVYPNSAWLRSVSSTEVTRLDFSRWNGTQWIKQSSVPPKTIGWVPWQHGATLRIERSEPHGTRILFDDGAPTPATFMMPPEIDRFDVQDFMSLPRAGILVVSGVVAGQSRHTLIGGAATASFVNEVGRSDFAVSPSCGRILFSQWIPGPQVRAVRIMDSTIAPGEVLPEAPERLAIDHACHEWFVSSDGVLLEHATLSSPWKRIPLALDAGEKGLTGLAAVGETVWVSVGSSLYAVRSGNAKRVDLPIPTQTGRHVIWLAPDEDNGRLWVAVVPVNEKRAILLTTGPVQRPLYCDDLFRAIAPK